MLRLAGERSALSIVADQFGCPTPAAALAARILATAERLEPECYGTYHCAGDERTSWYHLAEAIFAAWQALTGISEEQPSELQSLMRISYAVFCFEKHNTAHHTA